MERRGNEEGTPAAKGGEKSALEQARFPAGAVNERPNGPADRVLRPDRFHDLLPAVLQTGALSETRLRPTEAPGRRLSQPRPAPSRRIHPEEWSGATVFRSLASGGYESSGRWNPDRKGQLPPAPDSSGRTMPV